MLDLLEREFAGLRAELVREVKGAQFVRARNRKFSCRSGWVGSKGGLGASFSPCAETEVVVLLLFFKMGF